MSICPVDREILVDQILGVGANAAACSYISQSVCDYRDLIGTYFLPTLCVWGRHDQAVPVANASWPRRARASADRIPEGSGHCCMWEEPDLFNRAVADWIAALAWNTGGRLRPTRGPRVQIQKRCRKAAGAPR